MNETEKVEKDEPAATMLPVVYANVVQVVVGPWDIQTRFGLSVPGVGGTMQKWDVQVVQSVQHAKAFLRILQEQVRRYEERFGPVADLSDKVEIEKTEWDPRSGVSSTGPAPPFAPLPSAPQE